MSQTIKTLSRLSAGLAIALALGACGGGGGNTRADPPPAQPTTPPPPPPEPPPPEPPVVEPPDPAFSRHLTRTGAGQAHAAGLSGAGVRIGVIDSGVNRSHPALAGRVVANLSYIDPAINNLAVDDVLEHGTAVAQVIAGQAFGRWPGGLAPGAEIVSARVLSDTPPEDDGSGAGNEVSGALGLAPIHRDLMDRGVRIMNNSWGGLYWTNPAATAPIAAEYRPFIVEHGGLVVFSAGNSGFADPSDTSALPSQAGTGGSRPAADLERGWLAVVALDGDDPSRLAAYSNACGVAMDYCLAAPGTVVVTGSDDQPDAPGYWRWSGTSFAAPIVSGAAALVWEAFPYFDNDLVRQTLLGTASDRGTPGVDPVFGHGALDVAAAVRGPARFDWGDVVADFDDITSTWSNPISGEGGLVKRGSGTLVLDESGSFTGQTRVEGGTLRLEGNNRWSTDVTVAAGGRLGGYGRVETILNQGTVLSDGGTVFGTDGDYRQTAEGRLAVELGSELLVGGTAYLDGDLHVLGWARGYTTSASVVVLGANALVGRFATLSSAPSIFLQGSLEYLHGTHVLLNISRMDVAAAAKSLPGIGAAGLSSARRIEHAFDRIDRQLAVGGADVDGDVIRIAGALQGMDDADAGRQALDSLSGESHALATTLAFDTVDMGRRAMSSRIGRLQPGDPGGAWRQALGAGGTGAGIAGGGYHLDGWMMGGEQPLAPGLVSGFAFGETRADGRVGGHRDRSRERQTAASLYLGRLAGDGYAFGHVSAGRFDRDIQRSLFDGADARAGVYSAYSGRHASLGVEAGRHLRAGAWQLTPWLGADHVRLQGDGFQEWGSAFALRAHAATLDRTQATAGLRASRGWHGARLQAWTEWQQVLRADGFDVQASLAAIDSWSPLPLADAARSGGLVGLGLEARAGRDARLTLALDQRFGPRGDERMASLRYVLGF